MAPDKFNLKASEGARRYQSSPLTPCPRTVTIPSIGLVVAGDIRISVVNVELLTIRIRLLVCSIDKAEQIGLNWWRHDRFLVAPDEAAEQATLARLEERIAELERQISTRAAPAPPSEP